MAALRNLTQKAVKLEFAGAATDAFKPWTAGPVLACETLAKRVLWHEYLLKRYRKGCRASCAVLNAGKIIVRRCH